MIKNMKDAVAVITGGASGIGLATARRFLDEGMNVAIADISQQTLDHAVAELDAGAKIHPVRCDVSSVESNEELAREVVDRYGKVNVVYFNAGALGGIGSWRASDLSVESWKHTMSVNLDGPFFGTRAFLPLLEQQEDAHILYTSSAFGLITGLSDPACYFVSKAGLLSWAECLYHDLNDRGSHIGVTCVLPGNTKTGPYYALKEELARTEEYPENWDASVWGSRDYARDLIEYFEPNSTTPDIIVDAIVEALRDNTFYVTANLGGFWDHFDHRVNNIKGNRNPDFLVKSLDVWRPMSADE